LDVCACACGGSALGAKLLPFGCGHHPVMVEVHRIEALKHLCFELLERDRLGITKGPFDHALDAACAASTRGELCRRLLGFLAGEDAVVIGVDHLEQHLRALLDLRTRLVSLRKSRAPFLGHDRRRDCGRADHQSHDHLVHIASRSFFLSVCAAKLRMSL
jgi:hypothetical protein